MMQYLFTKTNNTGMRFFQVGMKIETFDWRDSSFVVATDSIELQKEIERELELPVEKRKMLTGLPVPGSGGYNKNGSHEFCWHYKEDDWLLVDNSIEVCDGLPHTDVDLNLDYWLTIVKRFCPWQSYIAKEKR